MSSINYMSQEGYDKLVEELDHLRKVERSAASKAIEEARDKGDLSENAEYDAAKEHQAMLELRINKMEELLANSRVVDKSKMDLTKVGILTSVRLLNKKINKEVTYTIVSEKEANLKELKISVGSPIGKGLMGRKVGEVVDVQIPAGKIQFEILEITF